MRIVSRSTAALLVLLATSAIAQAQNWTAAQVAQPSHYTLDAQTWHEIRPGMEIPNRSWIQTGRRGRVILRRESETIQFRPSTVAAITSRVEGGTLLTDVRQKTGSLLLDIETRATRHTSVETPFLAAVVKGTRFEVDVTRRGASLRVAEGVVETTHLSRGEQVDVRAGQSVEVSQNPSQALTVTGAGPKAPVVQVAPVTPSVEPAMTQREADERQEAQEQAPAAGAEAASRGPATASEARSGNGGGPSGGGRSPGASANGSGGNGNEPGGGRGQGGGDGPGRGGDSPGGRGSGGGDGPGKGGDSPGDRGSGGGDGPGKGGPSGDGGRGDGPGGGGGPGGGKGPGGGDGPGKGGGDDDDDGGKGKGNDDDDDDD